MADESASDDKTEEPTDRKLTRAREEGQVAQSVELKIWAGLMGALVIVGMMAPGMAGDIKRLLQPFIERPHAFAMDPGALGGTLMRLVVGLALALAMPMALLVAIAVAVSYLQHGFLFVGKRLMPDFSKISPAKGLARIFSVRNLVEFAKSMIKVTVVGALVIWALWSHMNEFANLIAVDLVGQIDYMQHRILSLLMLLMVMVTVVAAADFIYQRWDFNQKMRMSKQEIKDEHKQTEGDPMVKSRLRSLRMQRARQRMMTAVPGADVVVTNPTHYAVALKYDMETMTAPVLVAKGADLIAKRIREVAEENEVAVVENPPLARALFATVELDQEVPPEHYKAVAEVIGYVMRLKGKIAH
jgi:flagellar biosynthesis protein FlhB